MQTRKTERVSSNEHQAFAKRYKANTDQLQEAYSKRLQAHIFREIASMIPTVDMFCPSSSIVAPSIICELVKGGNKYAIRVEFDKRVTPTVMFPAVSVERLYNFINLYFEELIHQ